MSLQPMYGVLLVAGSRLTLVEPEKGKTGVALARYVPSNMELQLRQKDSAKAESEP